MAINIQKLDKRIIIEKRIVEYVKGFKKETWHGHYECWAELLDLFNTEKYAALQVKLENSIKFKCRMCRKLKELIGDDLKEYRLIWNKKIYEIKFVDSMNGSRTEIVLQVLRVN
ncbi:phage head closure protein [Clostridium sp. Marseille-Q2269]|uniref:phage head closure protein n=1 Tax=Clostridium sp. Marseille-Q2269 TaxID=2942205 RepID=UPI00207310D3|nr:phage head closure protein [Clostridium sp. Marseille-Q2269]